MWLVCGSLFHHEIVVVVSPVSNLIGTESGGSLPFHSPTTVSVVNDGLPVTVEQNRSCCMPCATFHTSHICYMGFTFNDFPKSDLSRNGVFFCVVLIADGANTTQYTEQENMCVVAIKLKGAHKKG